MKNAFLLLPVILILIISGCAPVQEPINDRPDTDLAGIWRRDDDSNGTDSFGDEQMILGADGVFLNGDYLDPDGPGPALADWLLYTFGYIWTNGFYEDASANAPPNNYISGNVMVTDGTGYTFLLFQYRYSSYPDELEVLTANSYKGIWDRQ